MGSSGHNLETGDFSYGRRRTFLKTFGHWEYTVSRAVPSAQADQAQLPSGLWHVPGPARFESRR